MNLVEELQNLDVNDVGRWPLAFRVAVIALVFVVVTGLGIYWFIAKDKAPLLERAKAEEQELRLTFENKQRKAANYDAYRAQLTEIEQSFGTMLRQLPPRSRATRMGTCSCRVASTQPRFLAGLGGAAPGCCHCREPLNDRRTMVSSASMMPARASRRLIPARRNRCRQRKLVVG